MRIVFAVLCVAVLLAGCGKTKDVAPGSIQPGKPIVSPDFRPTGKVQSVNMEARFVIISFPITNVPQPGHRLNLYRNGLKVGEVKITGPERDGNTVADLLAGEAQAQDQARED